MSEFIQLDLSKEVQFHNAVDFCVGTGRMGLALTEEYMNQLRLVQKEIGFAHVRGHGLFCDDMAIYQEYEEDGQLKVEYNYRYLDRVFDQYLSVGIRPFLELGFMPEKLASGSQTVFYWKGNTTPPKSYDMWCDMVQKLLLHLMERYGEEEVLSWPIEVWNEPNLPGFWEKADMQEYFKLFQCTFEAIKAINPKFMVGGPAVCGGTDEIWIKAFMEFCHENKLKIDYVTRHHYTIEFPENDGHYAYSKMMSAEAGFANLKTTRDIIDSYEEYQGLPIHITEFNSSYTPQGVIHDTNRNAAWIAQQLSRLGDVNESYSYWTFSDVFEEQGVPFSPFYGGFGLVADGCIPKPTFYTFAFYKRMKELTEKCIYRDDDMIVVSTKEGGFAGIVWNLTEETMEKSLKLPEGENRVCITKIVDPDTCNPLKIWHDLGEPQSLSKDQLELLRQAAKPLIETDRLANQEESVQTKNGERTRKTKQDEKTIEVLPNGLVYFEIKDAKMKSNRGYDYERVLTF